MVHALGPTNKCYVTRQVRWNPPPKDFIKINVDGSSLAILVMQVLEVF